MATKTKEIIIRETKENIFNALKAAFPSIFGDKIWTDVAEFIEDPSDTSKFRLMFEEEAP